jgi:hypothetical protein
VTVYSSGGSRWKSCCRTELDKKISRGAGEMNLRRTKERERNRKFLLRKKEMPGYQKLVDHYGSRGFVAIGFKFDTMRDMEDPVLFAKRIGVRYPLAVAADDVKQKFGGIEGLPTTMLYDRQGTLRMKVVGFE